MKKILMMSLGVLYGQMFAQVGINTTAPKATLDVEVNKNLKEGQVQGFLPPRMDTQSRDKMKSVPAGVIIFNSTTESLEVYDGSDWIGLTGEISEPQKSTPTPAPPQNETPQPPQETPEVTPDENSVIITFNTGTKNPPAPIKVKKGTKFVVLPQPEKRFNREFDGWTDREGALTKYVPGASLPEAQESMTLYANWNIIDLSLGGASENFRSQTVFVKGVEAPKESDWQLVRGFKQENLKTVTWKKEYKWYDTDQFTYNLCWAAGASNIVQWWLEQNAEYIKRYGKYDQPHEYRGRKDSDLFRFFEKSFENAGNRPDLGVLWYITGISSKNGGGFFKDVFEGKEIKKSSFFLTRRNFTEMIDDALMNGRGMIFVRANHAVTIWGADFDKDGYVSGIYYVNSADSAQAQNREEVGLFHSEVIYKEINGQLKPCLPGSVEGYYTQIGALSTFSLGQDIWEEYLTKHGK